MTIAFSSHIEVMDITPYNAPKVNGIGEELSILMQSPWLHTKKILPWGTLRKEGAPTALHLTPFRIVLSQSDARYPYGLGDVCFVLFVYNFFVPSWNGFCHIIIPT